MLSLAGQKSLLQETVVRLDDVQGRVSISPRPLVLCNEEYRFLIAEQLREIDRGDADIILEPVGRNTAPALTLAALHAEKELSGRLLLVMPSDHVIADGTAFHSAVMKGTAVASEGGIVTFGIVPACPETGYGYIKAGSADEQNVLTIDQFVEKPDAATAEQYIASGRYFWNSGIFLVRADVWLRAVAFLRRIC